MFLLPQLNGCAISPQMPSFGGCDTGTVSSLKDVCVCVCARTQVCVRVDRQVVGVVGGPGVVAVVEAVVLLHMHGLGKGNSEKK